MGEMNIMFAFQISRLRAGMEQIYGSLTTVDQIANVSVPWGAGYSLAYKKFDKIATIDPQMFDFLARINLTRYFMSDSVSNFSELARINEMANPVQKNAALVQWLESKGGDFSPTFKNGQAFFDFYHDFGGGMSETSKVAAIGFWTGALEKLYDKSVPQKPLSAQDIIGRYIGTAPVGVCGNLNGTFAKELAVSLGLKHSGLATWVSEREEYTQGSQTTHLVAFLKGREKYYLVDYGNSYDLGSNPDLAMERVFAYAKRFSPFSFSVDKSTFFDRPPSERMLLDAIGWMKPQVEEKFGISLVYDNGAAGLRLAYPDVGKWADFSIGGFVLHTPFALGSAFGASLNTQLHTSDKKPLLGVIEFPSLDFAIVKSLDQPPFAMAHFTPFSFDIASDSDFSAKFYPLRGEGAWGGWNELTGRLSSSLGFIYSKHSFGEVFASADAGLVPSAKVYDYPADAAWRFNLGYSSGEKGGNNLGNDTNVKVSWTPQSIISKVKADASQRIQLSEPLAVLLFVHATDLNGKSLSGGLQITYQFGK